MGVFGEAGPGDYRGEPWAAPPRSKTVGYLIYCTRHANCEQTRLSAADDSWRGVNRSAHCQNFRQFGQGVGARSHSRRRANFFQTVRNPTSGSPLMAQGAQPHPPSRPARSRSRITSLPPRREFLFAPSPCDLQPCTGQKKPGCCQPGLEVWERMPERHPLCALQRSIPQVRKDQAVVHLVQVVERHGW
jgi:hypothetical protein